MTRFGRPPLIAALLSFNAGVVDTAGFLGLAGLFAAHVTGNFVTLGAALVFGHHGIVNKILALPEFILVIALGRLAGVAMRGRGWPALRVLLWSEVALLVAFFGLAVRFGPFPDADAPIALLTAFAGIGAMAVQNGVQRVHLSNLPPTTIMTGNTTQFTLDAIDLMLGAGDRKVVGRRFTQFALGIFYFAVGCAVGAFLYWLAGFWCLGVAVAVAALVAVLQPQN